MMPLAIFPLFYWLEDGRQMPLHGGQAGEVYPPGLGKLNLRFSSQTNLIYKKPEV